MLVRTRARVAHWARQTRARPRRPSPQWTRL